jgi:hypothetical protein
MGLILFVVVIAGKRSSCFYMFEHFWHKSIACASISFQLFSTIIYIRFMALDHEDHLS